MLQKDLLPVFACPNYFHIVVLYFFPNNGSDQVFLLGSDHTAQINLLEKEIYTNKILEYSNSFFYLFIKLQWDWGNISETPKMNGSIRHKKVGALSCFSWHYLPHVPVLHWLSRAGSFPEKSSQFSVAPAQGRLCVRLVLPCYRETASLESQDLS